MSKPRDDDRLKPLSLYPMTPEEALRKAMETPPLKGEPAQPKMLTTPKPSSEKPPKKK